jgi:hypothetical protein
MVEFICETCGTQFAASAEPPGRCPICTDEQLRSRMRLRIEDDDGLLAFSMPAGLAIPQRALLLPTDAGNILWECVSLVTDEALGSVPILLHPADREWVERPSPRIEYREGETQRLSGSVELIRCGGHFPGSTALHWKVGPRPGGALFSGDALQVVQDRRHVSFMYSYPNFIPLPSGAVRAMRERLADFDFEDVYGFSWGLNIIGGGRAAVNDSFERYLRAVAS